MPKARTAAGTRLRARSRLAGDELRIGMSGWRYRGWRGKLYPKDSAQHRELEFAAGIFNSVEINGSFYSLQLPLSYQPW
jgi:uncharacterized protein YecE (DUF72 family)